MNTDTLVAQGKAALSRQDYDQARRLFRRALSQSPFRSDIRELLAMSLDERSFEPDDVQIIEPVSAAPRGPKRTLLLGVKPKKRRSSLARLVKPVIFAIALVMIGVGIFSVFHMRGLNAVPSSKPAQSPEIMEMIAQARRLSTSGRYEEAVLQLDKARKQSLNAEIIDKTEAEVHYLQANVMAGHKDYEEAIRILERAITLAPGEARYMAEKGWNQHLAARNFNISDVQKGKEFEKAACATLEKALELDPNNVLALHTLGRAYSALGERETASVHYRRLIELQPDSLQAQAARRELDQWGMAIH